MIVLNPMSSFNSETTYRICAKFLELGYEEEDLSELRSEKAFNQKAALSDSSKSRFSFSFLVLFKK
jgi:hypothetical protein